MYIRSFKSSIRKQADGGETTSKSRRERVEVRELIKHAGGPECDKSNLSPVPKKKIKNQMVRNDLTFPSRAARLGSPAHV